MKHSFKISIRSILIDALERYVNPCDRFTPFEDKLYLDLTAEEHTGEHISVTFEYHTSSLNRVGPALLQFLSTFEFD